MEIVELAKNIAREHTQVVSISLYVAILCLCLVVGHLLEENCWVNECITAILIGCLSEAIILSITKWKSSHILRFDEELFFIYLLPPIIFNAGFQAKKKQFFHNFLSIKMFGVIGVFISVLIITVALGTIFSSTDIVCTLQALFWKSDPPSAYKHSSVREIALMVLMAYLSYILAELLEISGILTVFFCGIVMSHYAWHNVTDSSRMTTRHIFAMMSFVAETFIFLYVGMDPFDIEKWKMSKLSFGTSLGVYSTLILLILLGRAAFVFPLSVLSNFMNRRTSSSISFKHQVVIWWAGLMREAVSIALAFKQFTYSGVTWDPISATMITNTIIIVLFTTLVFGFLTRPLVKHLLPHQATNNCIQKPRSPKEDMNLPLLSFDESTTTNLLHARDSLSMLIDRPVHTIHFYWRRFDATYMRPIFGGPNSSQSQC